MKKISDTIALITDIDRRKAIPIIRSLGEKGIKIIGLSYNPFPIGKTSRYCSKYFKCPDYNKYPIKFLERLREICRQVQPDVFYPIEDVVLSLCAQNPAYWKPYTDALFPNPEVLDICYDKWKTIQAAKTSGIITPITYCPNSIDEVKSIALNWKGQAVIKPRKSSGSRGIIYVDDPAKIVKYYKDVAKNYNRPLIQERLPHSGKGLGVFVLLNAESKPLAVFGHKRLREYPISGGPSTLRVSFRDNRLIEQTIKFFQKIGFTGVAMAEYKLDERTNTPILLEINPRFWGSLQLAISTGVDFPLLYHQTTLGIGTKPILNFKEGVFCRWLLPGDVLHFILNPKRFQLEPSFFNFFEKNQNYDILSIRDPLPILGIFIESLRRIYHNISKT